MLYRIVIYPHQKQDSLINLLSDQEHYLRRVVRLNNGQNFIAMDGKGYSWEVKLTDKGGEIIHVIEENRELSIEVTLMVALPKGNGFEDIIRCTTELGVNKLQPVISHRTLLKPSENKWERWHKIAVESAEQSERQIVPYIAKPIPVMEAFTTMKKLNIPKYIAVARTDAPHLLNFLTRDLWDSPSQIIIATGCEGGWNTDEIQWAIASNFQEVSLGKRILRAITAPITAMSLISGVMETNNK
ncbi:MAG: 16S rRNA (uracil(1498)-N(3))-methyltransferase [Cyanobacteria bacterium]|nr:16S rRNA (uracil(1498)-N(3))-methyltransferase [Cyanobacteria bacterium CG_2015-16_32_12]NCO79602.1 16S rRNA (uracil(1498)-N(3))-methyltransferase [Cyanobacteria bacterium CG_2015-22_32_23]NCQ03517.1 16S rRNA (uracil(1498)-N(3))-methyltransferase [Cyanobacteria bacterium CG_2015-09_32_10]NCQ40835.1 16S rRNA (uracil(1498)-N(3))-methyltransferase [Cyanobacteria bacterium CG_2015-04_32_10]NCS85526.1 16S rRNA (uracil(1498)-N(3))-methyltransferase [Cyanobacteria bacterium CG_2015-02_32_10]